MIRRFIEDWIGWPITRFGLWIVRHSQEKLDVYEDAELTVLTNKLFKAIDEATE